MKIVITGHNSLIGSNLAKSFAENNKVILLGTRNIFYRKYKFKYDFQVLNFNNLNEFFKKENNIDLFIHCAAMNAESCNKNTKEAFQFNVFLTEKLTKLCLINKVRCFIYLSSVNVYKNNPNKVIYENSPKSNDNFYSFYKNKAEETIENIARNTTMKYLILRLSNVLAKPLNIETNCWDLVTYNFCKEIVQYGKITINRNALNKRDFFDIKYLIEFIDMFKSNFQCLDSGIINFCSGKSITILDLALMLQSLSLKNFSYNPQILELKARTEPILGNSYYSIDKIKELGYENNNDIKNILNDILLTSGVFFKKLN